MSTLARPSEAAQAPAQPERRWWIVGLLVVVGVIVAAIGGFWLGRSTAPPTAGTDPLAPYAASPSNEWTPAIYTSGPDDTFADATSVNITRDGQPVGVLATLTLIPGHQGAINWDREDLLREAVSSDPGFEGKLAASSVLTEVIGSTELACAHPWGIPECAWFADDGLYVFKGKTELGDQFLQDYLGTRNIPTA